MPYFDDDGTEIKPGIYPKPNLCVSCKKCNDTSEEIVCNLTRMDQRSEPEFKCFAYENIYNQDNK
jgi:hypothetical protein